MKTQDTYKADEAASRAIITKARALAKAGHADAAWELAKTDKLMAETATKEAWLKWAIR